MPIYEYQCRRCGERREILHKISETPTVACDHCEGEFLERQVSAAAFRLKGGGWYETDFKKDGKRNLAGDAPPAAGGGDAGGTPAKADAPAPAPAAAPAAAPSA